MRPESYGPYIIIVGAADKYVATPLNVKFNHCLSERNYAGGYDTVIYKIDKSWGNKFDRNGYPLAAIIDLK
jgi:hypothetical protein